MNYFEQRAMGVDDQQIDLLPKELLRQISSGDEAQIREAWHVINGIPFEILGEASREIERHFGGQAQDPKITRVIPWKN